LKGEIKTFPDNQKKNKKAARKKPAAFFYMISAQVLDREYPE